MNATYEVAPRASSWVADLVDQTTAFDLACVATLLTLALYGPSDWYSSAPLLALAVAAFLSKSLRSSKVLWCGCLALCSSYVLFNFHTADNHKFLLAYWVLAIFLSLHAADPGKELAKSARWLIACVMTMAVIWKIVSPDYLNGQFFAHEMLFDKRFRSFTQLTAGVDDSIFEANRMALERVRAGLIEKVHFSGTPSVLLVARWLSWGGLAIEALVALCFLLPAKSLPGRYRDLPLMGFILTVYPLATVMGFGYVLAAMGAAQARTRRQLGTYFVLLVVMQLFTMPWGLFL